VWIGLKNEAIKRKREAPRCVNSKGKQVDPWKVMIFYDSEIGLESLERAIRKNIKF
jgi:hypothetical protein